MKRLLIVALLASACGSPVEVAQTKDCGALYLRSYRQGVLIQVDSIRVPCQ